MNKNLFSKADTLVDKNLNCSRIKLSNSQTLIWESVEFGFSSCTLFNNCVAKTQTFQTFTSNYLTPLVYLGLWFWMRKPKLKSEEAGSLSRSERQKLQRLYTQGGAAHGCERNFLKPSNLSVAKVRQFLHPKLSFTKFTIATGKMKRMKAITRFKNEI